MSVRDAPIVCLILAILLALLPWLFALGGAVSRNELQTVNGVVERVYQTQPTDALLCSRMYCSGFRSTRGHVYVPGYLHVVIGVNGAINDFELDGRLAPQALGLMELRSGDEVTALVDHAKLWQLQHSGSMILRYEDTRDFMGEGDGRTAMIDRAIAVLLIVVAMVQRGSMGAWRGDPEVPDDA